MNTPHKIQPQAKVDLKLGIKSSLPNVKSTISLFILLWEATGRQDTLAYAIQNGNDIVLPDSYDIDILVLDDGSYVLHEDDKTTVYGSAYIMKNGTITQICDKEQAIPYQNQKPAEPILEQ